MTPEGSVSRIGHAREGADGFVATGFYNFSQLQERGIEVLNASPRSALKFVALIDPVEASKARIYAAALHVTEATDVASAQGGLIVAGHETPGSARDRHVGNQGANRTRPMCQYPAWPRYNGSGSENEAANFTCVVQ